MSVTSDRVGRTRSLAILMEYYWIYLSKITTAVQSQLGDRGMDTLFEGVYRYGHFRGERMRNSARVCAEGRDAMSIFRAWDAADLILASSGDRLEVEGSPKLSHVQLTAIPGMEYVPLQSSPELIDRYWETVLRGIAKGFDEDHLAFTMTGERIECRFSGDTSGHAIAVPDDFLDDRAQSIGLSRSTLGDFAALAMYTGQALLDQYDATGEKVLREALYAFGLERAHAMRDAVLAENKPLNFETWFEAIQKRDPNASAFVFRGDYIVTPGVFQVRCTYCPCAETWTTEGRKGLDFGQIYDLEVHRGLVEGFHPDGIVAWETLKTRGDNVCNFRFYIPQLVSSTDPQWAQDKCL